VFLQASCIVILNIVTYNVTYIDFWRLIILCFFSNRITRWQNIL